jgi:NAD dependent epimerase/dehydratase family enzyme
MGEVVLLASQRVEPGKLIASGYPFQYADLKKALEEILKR